jgi:N-acetylated-alpha-linked acidic dipeptidase
MRGRPAHVATFALLLAGCSRSGPPPFGFTHTSAPSQHGVERALTDSVDPSRIRLLHEELTRLPHPAGSERDRQLAAWVSERYKEAGLDDVRITTHEVMLPRPLEIAVEMTAPRRWSADLRDGAATTRDAGLPYHAFSASGDVAGPVVHAGSGSAADYDWLASKGIDVRGRLVLVCSSPATYRYKGLAAFTAQQRGAAAILMYSDAGVGGSGNPGNTVPAAETRIERGSILYDFIVPGDPATPGTPSRPGTERLSNAEAVSLPQIVSTPISARDARTILSTLTGPAAPSWWSNNVLEGARVGPGPGEVRVRVRMDDAVRPVWTVTGMLRGSEKPDQVVIVGNHRDAWVYGGVDPSTGTAAMLELVRALGALARDGRRPKRSLLFASWDAEEFGLTSSVEWGEQHAAWLRTAAVAYLNVDSAAGGRRFVAGATPSLTRLIEGAAGAVRDPVSGMAIAAVERVRAANERGAAADGGIVEDRLGGGSDYAVFLNHLGVPSADVAFDGPFRVYHSADDDHAFVDGQADPGFRYTATLAKVLGVSALRLANAQVLPIDPLATATRAAAFLAEFNQHLARARVTADTRAVFAALRALEQAATQFAAARDRALSSDAPARFDELNRRLLEFERTFVDDRGLTGRPWYRHVLHAPAPSYEPLVLPGLHEAINAGDPKRLAAELARLSSAFRRAATLLQF